MDAMWRSRNFWWLFGSFSVLILSSIGLLGVIIVTRVENHFLRQNEANLNMQAVAVQETVHGHRGETPEQMQSHMEDLRDRIAAHGDIPARITLINDAGNVLADTERDPRRFRLENHAGREEVLAARSGGSGTARRRSATVDQEMMYVALRTSDAAPVAFVRVALPLDQINHQMASLQRLIWTAVGLTAAGAMALAFFFARRSAGPLQELTRGAEQIAAGGYGHKVYAVGRDEVGVLARAFNHMSGRLSEQFAQLEEDRLQLRAVLSGMVEGVLALDAEQRILFTNDRAGQLLGFETSAAVGRRLWEVVRQRSFQDVVRQVLADPKAQAAELDWAGSATRHLTVHAAPLTGPAGRGAVLVFHDTTELRRLERLRQEFVANVSHELKTPLSVIKACTETLINGAGDEPEFRASFLQQVAEQAERLHALILDLISLARIESGEEMFEFEPVDVGAAVHACAERQRARAEGKDQKLEVIAPASGVALHVWADDEAVGHILDNLVDNAVKYTPAGGRIEVRWRIDGDRVCIEVADTGIGIPERDLPRIFERFYRVDKARSRELGGTGLGLSIVKHLVQAMHGSVEAKSQIGVGSTFRVRLPLFQETALSSANPSSISAVVGRDTR
jgi:two-component system phosphate regulon sensor histidine kinase PhoR